MPDGAAAPAGREPPSGPRARASASAEEVRRPAVGTSHHQAPAPSARTYRILITLWFRKWAGDPRAVHELATGLIARGHEVLVACPEDGVLGERLLAAGVPVRHVEFGRGWSPATARRLAALVRAERVDLVDAHGSRDRKAALLARWLYGAPARLVLTRRGMSGSFPLENWLYAAAADRVVAISRGVAESLARRGTPRRKIAVVHTGMSPARLGGEVSDERVEEAREGMGLDLALPTLGVIARRKDQETLLRAVARLGRPVNVLFVGIDRDERLAALEPRLPAGTRVAYAGFRTDVRPFYRLLDVKVLPTRAEGLSQAILESMAMGVPVISAAVGGTPEVVADGENGLLFPPSDHDALAAALARLLDDPELRARLAAAGRRSIDGYFHADRLVERTEALYGEVLGDASRGGGEEGS